jgi:hypothetical protein
MPKSLNEPIDLDPQGVGGEVLIPLVDAVLLECFVQELGGPRVSNVPNVSRSALRKGWVDKRPHLPNEGLAIGREWEGRVLTSRPDADDNLLHVAIRLHDADVGATFGAEDPVTLSSHV